MKSCLRCLAVFLLLPFAVMAKSDLDYLPGDITYNPDIPKPEAVLGAPVGEWHVRHDQLVSYMRTLAASSDRVSLIETGRTHENRPLLLLAFTSPANQQNLEAVQQAHLARVKAGEKAAQSDPLVIWMGYGVHGDEPSGSNASLLVAYYLAAGQGDKIDALLSNNVVLIDPSLNPDGMGRFAQWANSHRGKQLVTDPNHREHVQGWPSGRTNHYWFDLNRDWLLLTHPESRARIAQFHKWRPNVLTDFHEMGTNSTYFFQPGIASRKNPWTPDENVRLTEALGDFHAAALDQTKQLYFTQEAFDDFYYGKGSTYPDVHGSVGILFEQASSRGHAQESINGVLRFEDTIQNQVTTSLSTFEGALATAEQLKALQANFVNQTREMAEEDDLAGYLVQENTDPARFERFLSILGQHQIAFNALNEDVQTDGRTFVGGKSVFIALDQPQYRLIRSIFSTRQRFNDNTFYDVSNWNLPLAFNLQHASIKNSLWRRLKLRDYQPAAPLQNALADDSYAYAFNWQHYYAPKLLQRLLDSGVQVRAAGEAFSASTSQGNVDFAAGAIVVPTALRQPDDLRAIVQKHADASGVKVWSLISGLTGQGIDLGSSKMRPVKDIKVLIVGGRGVSQYEVGEAWHYLDQHVGLAPSIVEWHRLGRIDLAEYSHMIWVNGNYRQLSESSVKRIGEWVNEGGVLIGQKNAARFFSQEKWLKVEFVSDQDVTDAFDSKGLRFKDKQAFDAKQLIAGATYQSRIDTSHPLAFGYTRETLPVFRNSDLIMRIPGKPFITVGRYTEAPLLAGYTADELQTMIAGSASIVAHRLGRGRVIGLVDNPNFRGYWYGTSRLLSNAIYMSGFINARG